MTDRYNTPVPPPDALAARFVLGIAPTENVPWWAAQWLADGYDGPALRELAGLTGRDPHEVNDLLPAALAEMGIRMPPSAVAAASEAFRQMAEMCLTGQAAERWVAQQVEDIVARIDYRSDVIDLPLGRLYGVEDEWEGGWGATVDELKMTVRARCAEQLRAPLDVKASQ
ncbi:hypothetical protein [Catenulispora subtropica]|uniref:DUF4259 domain-containing protein n=1 Tax=Catenulispora subtropica TaxID=450798 RepID=A0ABN2SY48_9ACTN